MICLKRLQKLQLSGPYDTEGTNVSLLPIKGASIKARIKFSKKKKQPLYLYASENC